MRAAEVELEAVGETSPLTLAAIGFVLLASFALAELGARLRPAELGAGLATVVPFRTDTLRRPLFEVPRSPRAFQLTLLRFPFPGTDVDGLLAQNRALHDLAVGLGGTRYIIGAVPGLTRADWAAHYGPDWWRLKAAKHWYDPHGVLTPGQGIFS